MDILITTSAVGGACLTASHIQIFCKWSQVQKMVRIIKGEDVQWLEVLEELESQSDGEINEIRADRNAQRAALYIAKSRSTKTVLLTEFCQWLEKYHYLDADWWAEPPSPVNRFLDDMEGEG